MNAYCPTAHTPTGPPRHFSTGATAIVTLYELTSDLIDMLRAADTAEDYETDKWLEALESALSEQLEEKLESCAKMVRQLQADEQALRTEADRFTARARSVKSHCERLKMYMAYNIRSLVNPDSKGRQRVETKSFLTWVQKNPMSVDKDRCDLMSLPGQYLEYEPKIKAREILEDIKKDGIVPDGVVLKEDKWSVRIK